MKTVFNARYFFFNPSDVQGEAEVFDATPYKVVIESVSKRNYNLMYVNSFGCYGYKHIPTHQSTYLPTYLSTYRCNFSLSDPCSPILVKRDSTKFCKGRLCPKIQTRNFYAVFPRISVHPLISALPRISAQPFGQNGK